MVAVSLSRVSSMMPNWRGNAPPATGGENTPVTGQTYVTGMPVAQLPMRPFDSNGIPGTGTGVPGRVVHHAAGNPAVSTVPSVPPPQEPLGEPRVLGVGQESAWRGAVFGANDKLTVHDRHLIRKTGIEYSGRDSGFTDPPMDGPSRPSYQAVNRTINYQAGSDATRNQDDLTRAYTRNGQGMYVGEQGSGWIGINGGVPGLWIPYGSYAGYTNGPVQGIQSPFGEGETGDGRHSVFSGPPHGLHSQTMPTYAPTLGYYMSVPQMQRPRQDRPSNSTSAGQSYSQTVQMQGQTSGNAQSARNAGVNWASRKTTGWRGKNAG